MDEDIAWSLGTARATRQSRSILLLTFLHLCLHWDFQGYDSMALYKFDYCYYYYYWFAGLCVMWCTFGLNAGWRERNRGKRHRTGDVAGERFPREGRPRSEEQPERHCQRYNGLRCITSLLCYRSSVTFSALTSVDWQQGGHLVWKNWVLICCWRH